jgi:hypothetical protein
VVNVSRESEKNLKTNWSKAEAGGRLEGGWRGAGAHIRKFRHHH